MGKAKKPKTPPPPPPPAEAVDVAGQQQVMKDSRKRRTGAKQAWLTRGQTLGGGTQLK